MNPEDIDRLPFVNRKVSDFRDNLFFKDTARLLDNIGNKKRRDMCSCISEDVVTWNVFCGLMSEEPIKGVVSLPDLITGKGIEIPLNESRFFFWNKDLDGRKWTELYEVLPRVEANPKRPTEVDAALLNRSHRLVVFFDCKLTSEHVLCGAPFGQRRECRLHRRSQRDPKYNGCSYWGDKNPEERYGWREVNFVHKYFVPQVARVPKRDWEKETDKEETKYLPFCCRYYQMMRNWIVGNEVANSLGFEFRLVEVASEGCFEKKLYRGFRDAIINDREHFHLITWQGVMEAEGTPDAVKRYLQKHRLIRM